MDLFNFFKRCKQNDGRAKYLDRKPILIKKSTHHINRNLINKNAAFVVQTLQSKGFSAYLVGGCVRDLLIGRKPKDFDVVTNAVPGTIRHLFKKARIIGRRFRIVHITFGREIIETATFRALPSADKGEDILLTQDNIYGTDREDAVRRDFTINALFYDPIKEEILDYVGGYNDIKRKILRIIGNPNVSYREDPVRMIRALKFQATTNFQFEKQTYREIEKLAAQIKKCSSARVVEEIYKIMRSGLSCKIIYALSKSTLLKYLIPILNKKNSLNQLDFESFQNTQLGKRLTVLDELTSRGRYFNNPVFLTIFFYGLIYEELKNSTNKADIGHTANIFLTEAATHIGFSKKDKDQMVKILLVQKKFLKQEKRPSAATQKFIFKEHFKDSLDFFEINCRIEKKGSDQLLYWVNQYKKNLQKIKQLKLEKKNAMKKKKSQAYRRRQNRTSNQ